MAWWQFLDRPEIYTTQGVVVYSILVAVLSLAAGLGLAFLWHRWKEGQKRKRAAAVRPRP